MHSAPTPLQARARARARVASRLLLQSANHACQCVNAYRTHLALFWPLRTASVEWSPGGYVGCTAVVGDTKRS
eukprot:4948656-Prymnesium_polylepis.1